MFWPGFSLTGTRHRNLYGTNHARVFLVEKEKNKRSSCLSLPGERRNRRRVHQTIFNRVNIRRLQTDSILNSSSELFFPRGRKGGGDGGERSTKLVNGFCPMSKDPRILTTPRRSTSDFFPTWRTLLAPGAKLLAVVSE